MMPGMKINTPQRSSDAEKKQITSAFVSLVVNFRD